MFKEDGLNKKYSDASRKISDSLVRHDPYEQRERPILGSNISLNNSNLPKHSQDKDPHSTDTKKSDDLHNKEKRLDILVESVSFFTNYISEKNNFNEKTLIRYFQNNQKKINDSKKILKEISDIFQSDEFKKALDSLFDSMSFSNESKDHLRQAGQESFASFYSDFADEGLKNGNLLEAFEPNMEIRDYLKNISLNISKIIQNNSRSISETTRLLVGVHLIGFDSMLEYYNLSHNSINLSLFFTENISLNIMIGAFKDIISNNLENKNDLLRDFYKYSQNHIKTYSFTNDIMKKVLIEYINGFEKLKKEAKEIINEIDFSFSMNFLKEILQETNNVVKNITKDMVENNPYIPSGKIVFFFVNEFNGEKVQATNVSICLDGRTNRGRLTTYPENEMDAVIKMQDYSDVVSVGFNFSQDHFDISPLNKSDINKFSFDIKNEEYCNVKAIARELQENARKIITNLVTQGYFPKKENESESTINDEDFVLVFYNFETKSFKMYSSEKYFYSTMPQRAHLISKLDGISDTFFLAVKSEKEIEASLKEEEENKKQEELKKEDEEKLKQEQILNEIKEIYGEYRKWSKVWPVLRDMGIQMDKTRGKGSHEGLMYKGKFRPVSKRMRTEETVMMRPLFLELIEEFEIPLETVLQALKDNE